MPSSLTDSTTASLSIFAPIVICEPGGEYFAALSTI